MWVTSSPLSPQCFDLYYALFPRLARRLQSIRKGASQSLFLMLRPHSSSKFVLIFSSLACTHCLNIREIKIGQAIFWCVLKVTVLTSLQLFYYMLLNRF